MTEGRAKIKGNGNGDTKYEEWFKKHAPEKWTDTYGLKEKIIEREQIWALILDADIRRSTFLMREAVEATAFADTLSKFVELSKRVVKDNEGWFDKFTGDGFLAYWPYKLGKSQEDAPQVPFETALSALNVARSLVNSFNDAFLPSFHANSRNFPVGTGLSIGLDAGKVHLLPVGGDLTVVGSAVVGAVRMVSAAHIPGEIIANVYLGDFLKRNYQNLENRTDFSIRLDYRKTKEYSLQEVYCIQFATLQDRTRQAEELMHALGDAHRDH